MQTSFSPALGGMHLNPSPRRGQNFGLYTFDPREFENWTWKHNPTPQIFEKSATRCWRALRDTMFQLMRFFE